MSRWIRLWFQPFMQISVEFICDGSRSHFAADVTDNRTANERQQIAFISGRSMTCHSAGEMDAERPMAHERSASDETTPDFHTLKDFISESQQNKHGPWT
ncbi:hypothetical protein IRJ41_004742 [Triplophysa rosa]|uniref:Uncharacterized protein n=1 Tax=Triplophysa rosa TaxID=992332 RepID=A0A9W8C9N2_TRIRA|nr:hypothetical protein IRJ41_004742 [Triplophysa rosa]